MNRLQSDFNLLREKGYEVVAVFLQGSQNYGLDTEKSDIDTKAIVLPRFAEFVENAPAVSTSLTLDSNEKIDIKDIRVMFDVLKKSNVNFLEILFTQHKFINPKYSKLLSPLSQNRERLAFWNRKALYNSISGMTQQKLAALKHPYPSIVDKINKFGYDPKQLHHILRLHQFLTRLAAGETFHSTLTANDTQHLLSVKAGCYKLHDAERLGRDYAQAVSDLKNKLLAENSYPIDEAAVIIYDDIKTQILKVWFREELVGG